MTFRNATLHDLFYVYKDFQGQEIASQLMSRLERKVLDSQAERLTADVSISAKLFFEKNGFKVVKEQQKIQINY